MLVHVKNVRALLTLPASAMFVIRAGDFPRPALSALNIRMLCTEETAISVNMLFIVIECVTYCAKND
jgi:hypothetical protein